MIKKIASELKKLISKNVTLVKKLCVVANLDNEDGGINTLATPNQYKNMTIL